MTSVLAPGKGRSTICIATTATAFAVFAYTLCPTVYAGDSGELALAAWRLGVPHPPGYPVFVLLGRLATLARGVEPALATNFMSALLSAVACGLLALLLMRLGVSTWAAVSAALVLAMSRTFWSQANITEVYSLAALGTVILLLALEAAVRTGSMKSVYLVAYLCGLLPVIHQSLLLFLPAGLYVCIRGVLRHGRRRSGIIVAAASLLLLGFSPYLFPIVRSHADPSVSWGGEVGPGRMLSFLLRRNYGALRQNEFSFGLLFADFQDFFDKLIGEFTLPVLILSIPGVSFMGRRKVFGKVLLMMFLGFLLGMVLLINPYPDSTHASQFTVLYLPLFVLTALLIGAGMHALPGLIAGRESLARRAFAADELRVNRMGGKALWGGESPGPNKVAMRFFTMLALVAPLALGVLNFRYNDRSDFFDARVYGENILRSLPKGATLVLDGDNETFIVAYLVKALGLRPDVELLHRKGYMFDAPEGLRKSKHSELAEKTVTWEKAILESRRTVFFATYCNLSPLHGWVLMREGLLFRAVRKQFRGDDAAGEGKGASGERERSWNRDGILLGSYDLGVLERDPGRMDFITRKFAIGYLQGLWERARKEGDAAGADSLLAAIGRMGYDFAEAQYLVAMEMERRGELEKAYERYVMSARLDPRSPFPWQAVERLSRRLKDAAGR
jgi:hypothetical protein